MDGTIVDASEGILKRLHVAHDYLGLAKPTHADLIDWIGPPMHESFQRNHGLDPDAATEAVTYYRSLHHADETGSGARLFDGIADLLADVSAAGIPQAIASSKPEDQVHPLADHFRITDEFVTMVGAGSDEVTRASKADVVKEALRRLADAGVDTSKPVLIGDRHHDVEGGAANGVPVIHVTWGFSRPEEAQGAIAVANTMEELHDLLLQG